jgi:hypothetical protein
MNRHPLNSDDSLDTDPVWKLLDEAPAPRASERFVERTLRAARLDPVAPVPFWKKWLSPAPLLGLGSAAAVMILVLMSGPRPELATELAGGGDVETFAAIQEAAEMEALLAAVDQMEDFSDHELVSLIGF